LIELRSYIPFGDILPSQSLGLVLNNQKKHNKANMHP